MLMARECLMMGSGLGTGGVDVSFRLGSSKRPGSGKFWQQGERRQQKGPWSLLKGYQKRKFEVL